MWNTDGITKSLSIKERIMLEYFGHLTDDQKDEIIEHTKELYKEGLK